MASWSELHRTAATALATSRIALARVPSGATRAAFVPGQTSGPCGSWSLDHVLFSSRTLTPSARWATLEALPDDAAAGLPTVACPSDHLPLGAAFEIAPAPALDAAGRAAFLASLAALEAAQAAERAALATEQEREMSFSHVLKVLRVVALTDQRAVIVAVARAGGEAVPVEVV